MKKAAFFKIFFTLAIIISISGCKKKEITSITSSKQALIRLLDGNKRYVNNESMHPNRSEERRKELHSKQVPYAIIVGCSDSRVSPEIIFDEGLGDLFVVRIAGNVIGPIELESIEYSATELNSVIILVLGHENCGAVNAVLQNKTADIKNIASLIEPAIQQAQKDTNNELQQAIKNNALNMKAFLENTPNIAKLIKKNKLQVHAGYYNLKSGVVELLNR